MMNGRLPRMTTSLRPVRPDDQDFLFKLYASTRQHEVSAWGWSAAQQEAFLRMQISAQQRSYENSFPQAEVQVVMLHESLIGRMIVWRGADVAVLVDISLLPEHRGHGIGGGLVSNLIEQCDKDRVAVRLQVLKTNPAARLYERLGFRKTGEDELYLQMEKRSS
jgi:ribosomal protein S18 acetylase RimI-like enzyme